MISKPRPELENLLLFDDNLAAWGWFYIILGVLLVIAGFAVFSGSQWGRWFGIVFVSIAIFTHFSWMYAFPVQALVAVVIDVFVLYALLAYGGRDEAYARSQRGVLSATRVCCARGDTHARNRRRDPSGARGECA